MSLILENPNNLELDDFCKYLKNILYIEASDTTNINAKLIEAWNDYLKIVFPEIKSLDVRDVRLQYFYNQIYSKYSNDSNDYIIEVDKNIKLKGTDITIERIANTIEKGTLDIKGYEIFTQVYRDIGDMIPILYNRWRG